MPGYFAIGAMILLVGMVAWRAILLRRLGITAVKFGQLDKKDFLIPPFVFVYLYLILANAFGWPGKGSPLIPGETVRWLGVILCALGAIMLALALYTFGKSFRIGIDEDHPWAAGDKRRLLHKPQPHLCRLPACLDGTVFDRLPLGPSVVPHRRVFDYPPAGAKGGSVA